ncbi:hypothetical protein BCR37DRAFT_389256 [Protomyces lactucae-debilis]|uniref:Uncharacterized protein n=1 Tax=Protomyces lactucae-debilis TaxID=2754530 RepID=A0A1Y2EZJ2_PROLT|nr:uncharacterized protein BCR37DRAFT_389256 [Protomyces lactucae-debilis]ORY76990.1 hypothetical protein BCR37DRAFT_389256 [Protomyces lactucae-debilis]
MTVTIGMALLVMALEGYVFARFELGILGYDPDLPAISQQKSKASKAIPTYFSLFLFAEVFGLGLTWDSLRLKNTIQVIGLCIYHLALATYSIIQIAQIRDALVAANLTPIWNGTESRLPIRPFLFAIPPVIIVFNGALVYLAYRLYNEFGWTIYKHIGADLQMRRRYMAYQIFVALLKFDFVVFVGFSVQFAVIQLDRSDPEFYMTLAVIPITMLGLLCTSLALRREIHWAMYLALIYFLAGAGYFVFKVERMYAGPKAASYGAARRPLVTFAILTLALLVASIANAIVCMRNFGFGLKQILDRRRVDSFGRNMEDGVGSDFVSPHYQPQQYDGTGFGSA